MFQAYVRGQEILHKGWVGTITSVKRNLYFRHSTGTVVYVETDETDGFMNNDPYWGSGAQCPGRVIRLQPSVLKKAKFPTNSFTKFIWKLPGVSRLYALNDFTILAPKVRFL